MFTRISYFCCLLLLSHTAFSKERPMGTIDRPVIMAMVPGQDSIVLKSQGEIIQKCLEQETKLIFKLIIPTNFVAIVEAFGTKRVDLSLMNTYGYILAHQKFKATARLIGTYKNKSEYWGQIIARSDGPQSIAELNGKTFAFVDPASTSGYVLPAKLIEDEKIKLKSTVFAGKHDFVVTMVYQGRVDAGATYHTLPDNGVPQDARTLVQTQFPDVLEKVKILKVIGPIPSDPIVFGAHMSKVIQDKIVKGFITCSKKPTVQDAFMKTYHLDGVLQVSDDRWNDFRQTLKAIGKNPEELLK